MGILKKSLSTKSKSSAVTIIAPGNKLSGDMSIIGKTHIDGEFDGCIQSLDSVFIGKSGLVSGSIKARHVNVAGRLSGEVCCETLHIERGGQVNALVISKEMSIDPAGHFIGERQVFEQQMLEELKQVLEGEQAEPAALEDQSKA